MKYYLFTVVSTLNIPSSLPFAVWRISKMQSHLPCPKCMRIWIGKNWSISSFQPFKNTQAEKIVSIPFSHSPSSRNPHPRVPFLCLSHNCNGSKGEQWATKATSKNSAAKKTPDAPLTPLQSPPLHAFSTPFQNKIQEKMPLKRKKLEFLNVPFKPFSYICPRFSKSSTSFSTSDALWNTKMPRQPTPSQRVYVGSYPVLDRSLRGGKKGTRTTVRIKETDSVCPPVRWEESRYISKGVY